MKDLLLLLAGAFAYKMYQDHQAKTQAANLVSSVGVTQNADGSSTLTFPDGSTAKIDAAALAWMQTLAPNLTATPASTAAASTAATTPAAPAMGALTYRQAKRGGNVVPIRPIYLPSGRT